MPQPQMHLRMLNKPPSTAHTTLIFEFFSWVFQEIQEIQENFCVVTSSSGIGVDSVSDKNMKGTRYQDACSIV